MQRRWIPWLFTSTRALSAGPQKSKSKWKLYLFGSTTVVTGLYTTKVLWPDVRSQVDPIHYYSDWKIRVYTSLPLNAISKFTGFASTLYIPTILRNPLYGLYVRIYNCNMDETIHPDLKAYKSFAEFFNRPLLETARPISAAPMVSPADGTVLHIGEIEDGRVEYVKGHDYDVQEFLGPVSLKLKPNNKLLQVVIYLAPGDYHAFHSPATWNCHQQTHFPGHLLSVRPSILEKIPLLFCLNERMVLNGGWKDGFFSMTAVAATNVGDISIEKKLEESRNAKTLETEEFESTKASGILYNTGEKVGEFRLGSTIVLIFETQGSAKFAIQAGEKVKFGQSLLLED
ncbi:unnamed protein product [Bursaphelenchus xylophilus]|uniref:phosphatidylserine decarboxylase n=1 Tax=Bursaphelenchus xylophilus TaxID=6326 RepID=A0A1I7STH6_BURXY|nr:unnamed protein product [Bursaphelenchus xylophilus]CAG9108408.1 unnamed protein product [Bursaphelenchus xylophilus]